MRHIFTVAVLSLALSGCATSRSVEQVSEAPSADQVALMQAWTPRATWGNKGMGVAAERAPGYIHVLTTAQPGFRPLASRPFVLPPSMVENIAWQKYCSGQGNLSSPEWAIVNASVAHCRIPDEFRGRCFPSGRTNACGAPGACQARSATNATGMPAEPAASVAPTASADPSAPFATWRAWTRYCGGGRLTPADQAVVASTKAPAGFSDCRMKR